MDKELKLKIFLSKSKLRKEVWNNLDNEKTATDIGNELKKHRSSVSRVLLDMDEAGLVRCVNPDDKSFRHYVKV